MTRVSLLFIFNDVKNTIDYFTDKRGLILIKIGINVNIIKHLRLGIKQ